MAKPLEDRGHLVAVTKPLQLHRRDASRLPDAGQCTDCLIIINDMRDGVPRARLALSNGATWDHVAWLDEVKPAQSSAVALRPADIDLTPMVRAAVEQALPALMPRIPEVKVVQSPQPLQIADGNAKLIADAMLEMSNHVNSLQHQNADLMARVEFLERNAIAKVTAA